MRAAFAVIHIGHNEHVEILVGFHQRIGKTHALDRVDIVVNVAVHEQQAPFQLVGHGDVRLRGVVVLHGIPLIQLVPPGFIEPRIVIAGDGDTNFVEVRKD